MASQTGSVLSAHNDTDTIYASTSRQLRINGAVLDYQDMGKKIKIHEKKKLA